MSTNHHHSVGNGVSHHYESGDENWALQAQIEDLTAQLTRTASITKAITDLLSSISDRLDILESRSTDEEVLPQPSDFARQPEAETGQEVGEDDFDDFTVSEISGHAEEHASSPIIVPQSELEDALRIVTKACGRQPGDYTSLLRIQSGRREVNLSCFNGEVLLSQSVFADVPVPADFAVPARQMRELIKALPDSSIAMEIEETRVLVRCESFSQGLEVGSAESFPEFDYGAEDLMLEVPCGLFHQALARTEYIAERSAGDARTYRQGVYLEHRDGITSIVATQGHTLGAYDIETGEQFGNVTLLIPQAAAKLLLEHTPAEGGGKVKVFQRDGFAFFEVPQFITGNRTKVLHIPLLIGARLLTEKYPEWRRILHCDGESSLTVDAKVLSTTVKRVTVGLKDAVVGLSAQQGLLTVAGRKGDDIHASQSLTAEREGQNTEIALSAEYLTGVLDRLSGEVTLQISSPTQPQDRCCGAPQLPIHNNAGPPVGLAVFHGHPQHMGVAFQLLRRIQ